MRKLIICLGGVLLVMSGCTASANDADPTDTLSETPPVIIMEPQPTATPEVTPTSPNAWPGVHLDTPSPCGLGGSDAVVCYPWTGDVLSDPAALQLWASDWSQLSCEPASVADTLMGYAPSSSSDSYHWADPIAAVKIGEGGYPGEQWWILSMTFDSYDGIAESGVVSWLTNALSRGTTNPAKGLQWLHIYGCVATTMGCYQDGSEGITLTTSTLWWQTYAASWPKENQIRGQAAWGYALNQCLGLTSTASIV